MENHLDIQVANCAGYPQGARQYSVGYCRPLDVGEDEVPADLLARLAQTPHKSPHTAANA